MKTTLRIAALAAALTFAGATSAQESARPARVGIGVGLPTSELSSLLSLGASGGIAPPQIYVPINIAPAFRLEPQIGMFTFDEDGGGSGSVFSLGTGAFYVMDLGQSAHTYVGGRMVLSFFNEESGGTFVEKTKGTDLWLAGALGGEVMVHPRLGVGAEAQFGRLGIGDREVTVNGASQPDEPGGTSWQTQGVIFVRMYLF